MSKSYNPRSKSGQGRCDPPPHIFEQVPVDAKPISADDIDAMCGPDVEPQEIETSRWPINRARILLRELYSKIKDRGGHVALYIIADLAFTASEENHEHWISYWLLKFAPSMPLDQLDYLIEHASSRYWTGDQIATAFDVTFKDKIELELQQTGASDDYDGSKRLKHQQERKAANSRAHRARNSSGRRPGRPPLDMTPEAKAAHRRAQKNESARRRRADKNPVTGIKTPQENLLREKSRVKCRHPTDQPRVIYLSAHSISMSFGRIDVAA